MSEVNENIQNDPASENEKQKADKEDLEKEDEKSQEDKISPVPAVDVPNLKFIMTNQNVVKRNRQLHKLYLVNKCEECLTIIEEILRNEPEQLCEYALILKAKIYQEGGDVKTALNVLSIAIKHNPNSAKLLYLIGRARYLLGEHEKAIECFNKSIEFNQNNWRVYYWSARAHYHAITENDNRNLNAAQEVLMSCPKLKKCVDILVFLAKICIQKNDIISAIEALKHALEIEPENTDVIAELGLLYLKTNNDQKAFSSLGKALSYDPTHVSSILAASTVLQRNNDFDVALSKYRVAIEKCDYNGSLWNNVGMCFYGKGKLIAAISCLKKAAYQYPLDGKVLYNLAIVHRSMYQFASAYHFISSAVNLHNKNVTFIMTIAIILTDLEDHNSARKAYKKAMSIDPKNIIVRLNYAIFEYRCGNIEEAKTIIEPVNSNLLSDSPDTSEIILKINKLRAKLFNN